VILVPTIMMSALPCKQFTTPRTRQNNLQPTTTHISLSAQHSKF